MNSKTISSAKSSISSKKFRDSNVEPINSCLSAQLALSHVNCEDKIREAPETGKTETTVEKQSNDGNEAGINDGDRLINSRVGKKTEFTLNNHVRDNGLNLKIVKVEKG